MTCSKYQHAPDMPTRFAARSRENDPVQTVRESTGTLSAALPARLFQRRVFTGRSNASTFVTGTAARDFGSFSAMP